MYQSIRQTLIIIGSTYRFWLSKHNVSTVENSRISLFQMFQLSDRDYQGSESVRLQDEQAREQPTQQLLWRNLYTNLLVCATSSYERARVDGLNNTSTENFVEADKATASDQ